MFKKIWPSAALEPAISGFPTTVTPDTCIEQDTNNSADLNSARHEQFQEKEKKPPTTELNVFLPIFFSSLIPRCAIAKHVLLNRRRFSWFFLKSVSCSLVFSF